MKKKDNSGSFVSSSKEQITYHYLMIREMIRDYNNTGALCPSSDALSNEMVSALSEDIMRKGIFVELGAGTGSVTSALLRHGMPPERLFVVERSKDLADCLKKRFPQANILCCGAEEIRPYLGGQKVSAIISSLPFRCLPIETSVSVMALIEEILEPGGLYIQYTYSLRGRVPFVPDSFCRLKTKFVLCNIPPAFVAVYRKPVNDGKMDELDKKKN